MLLLDGIDKLTSQYLDG